MLMLLICSGSLFEIINILKFVHGFPPLRNKCVVFGEGRHYIANKIANYTREFIRNSSFTSLSHNK